MSVKSREQLNPIIGKSVAALDKILSFIRMNYIMDEYWDGKDELKFRRGGKTLATIYMKALFWNTVWLILLHLIKNQGSGFSGSLTLFIVL